MPAEKAGDVAPTIEIEDVDEPKKDDEDLKQNSPIDLNIGGAGSFNANANTARKSSAGSNEVVKDQSKKSVSYILSLIFQGILSFFGRLFTFPLVRDPISYYRPGDPRIENDNEYAEAIRGEEDKRSEKLTEEAKRKGQIPASSTEVICNYDSVTKNLFEHILKDRKETQAAKDNYQFVKVDLQEFPGWTDVVIDRLRSTFQVFDISGDGLVDFEELSAVLTEFGDQTPVELRKKFFEEQEAARNSGAIDFMDFIRMIYKITMQSTDPTAVSLAESYRAIDRNMARIRSLDVVQQLQAGFRGTFSSNLPQRQTPTTQYFLRRTAGNIIARRIHGRRSP